LKKHNPPDVAAPFATYTHGIELDGPHRLLFGAGQAGADADGVAGSSIEEQARLVWQNIERILADAGMEISDLVQINMLLLDRADYPVAAAVRGEALSGHRPASTLMYVAGLARPEWRIEIDFVAAREA
jgi:2-iminobutanoate/2-iminopropanoate deaminase